MANCPECETQVIVDEDVEEGQKLDCPECGNELEIVNTNPLELKIISTDENGEGTW